MIYTKGIRNAIQLAIETHEIYGKQKRKGKNIPYIVHPFAVGLTLAMIGGKEELIIAGILHDTIEDSINDKKVTVEKIEEIFGKEVASLVSSVTDDQTSSTWEERKERALKHIKDFSNDSVLLKSADIMSNVSEIKDDYDSIGDKIFEIFYSTKEKTLAVYEDVIDALILKYPESPLKEDLEVLLRKINEMK
jgi:(p)ppGpp synthase/HD superfamily hydrolase